MKRSFGATLKGARLGYHWCERIRSFLRTSVIDDERILIEIAPHNYIPNKSVMPKLKEHVVWWERGEGIIDSLEWLGRFHTFKRYVAVVCDNDGRIVQELTK